MVEELKQNEAYKRLDLSFLKDFKPSPQELNISAPLKESLRAPQETIKKNLASLVPSSQGPFETMNLDFFKESLFIRVPEAQKEEEPISSIFDGTTNKHSAAFFPRTLIALAPHSQAVYLEECRGASPGLALWDQVTEIVLGENACLTYIAINKLGPKFKSFVFESASLEANAKLQIFHLNLGSEINHIEIRSVSRGANSRLEVLGSVLGQGAQHVSAWILNQHEAPNTKSHILWKSALSGESKSSFLAWVRIAKNSDGAETFQACHNLLLSKRAAAYPDPRLEILSNNVKAKHAASVGYLNPEEKFYLASRGLDEASAEKLMTAGFLAEPMKYLSPTLNQLLEKKLREKIYKNDDSSKDLFN